VYVINVKGTGPDPDELLIPPPVIEEEKKAAERSTEQKSTTFGHSTEDGTEPGGELLELPKLFDKEAGNE